MSRKLSSLLVPSFVTRRYTVKFVVSILFVLLAIGLVGYVGYAQVTETITDDTRASIDATATMQADTISEWTANLEYQTRLVGQLPGVAEGSATRANGRIVSFSNRLESVSAVHVVDIENDTVVTTTTRGDGAIEPGQPLDSVEEPWGTSSLALSLRGDTLWVSPGSYNSSAVPGTRAVAFATLTSNTNRAVVVAAAIDSRIEQLHGDATDQTTTIVDPFGEYVLSPQGTQRARITDQGRLDAIQRAIEGDTVTTTQDGGTVRGYAAVDGRGSASRWVAITSVPASEAYAVRDAVGANVILIVATGLLTLGIVGVVLGRQTVTPLRRLRSKARSMESGDLDVDLQTRRTDEIGQLYGAFDSMRRSLREQITAAESARAEAEAERERVERINRELEATADDYSRVMQAAADGDLTTRMDTGAENEAMADIAAEFNDMLGEIEETVEELDAFAAEVATASEEVTASSEEVRSSSEQISESVQEISTGAETQNEALRSVDRELSDLSTTTEEIASSSNEVADIAERTADTGEAGQEAAQAAIEGMADIEAESSQAVEEISQLEAEVGQIDELIERIQEISDQTNMLALNANIEASRSTGSGGDGGFGVVAQEVKELSQDAKDAAEEVENRLEAIREQTRRSAEEVERTSDDVDDAARQVQAAVDALEEIAAYAHETNDGVQEISAATQQQAASTQEVVAMVDEAATISEETTAEAESVAAAAEEQTTALTEVSRSASDLSEQAARLSEALDRFDTDAEVDADSVIRPRGADDSPAGVPADATDAGQTPGPPGTDDSSSGLDAASPDIEGITSVLQNRFDLDHAKDEAGPTATADDGGAADTAGSEAADDAADESVGTPDHSRDVDAFDPDVDAADFGADVASGDAAASGSDPADGTAPDGASDAPDDVSDDGEAGSTGADAFDFDQDLFDGATGYETADATLEPDRSLAELDGVGRAEAEALRAAGFETVADVRAASHGDLAAVEGIGPGLAARIRNDLGEH